MTVQPCGFYTIRPRCRTCKQKKNIVYNKLCNMSHKREMTVLPTVLAQMSQDFIARLWQLVMSNMEISVCKRITIDNLGTWRLRSYHWSTAHLSVLDDLCIISPTSWRQITPIWLYVCAEDGSYGECCCGRSILFQVK